VRSGVVSVDGTRLSASANSDCDVDYDRIAKEIIAEAIATDAAEDERHGEARGDELPPELQTEAGRREWLTRVLEQEQAAEADGEDASEPDEAGDPLDGFDAERILARTQGRQGWLREAHRQLEQERWETAGPIPRSRFERLRMAAGQFEENLAAELRGNRAYEASRAQRQGTRRLGGPPKPYEPPAIPQGEVNVTDPDSRRMKGNRRYIQGYNAQAVVNEQQIVIAAEISTAAGDFSHLRPMIEAALGELERAGESDKPTVAVADAQYWNEQHMDDVTAQHGIQVLIPTRLRQTQRRAAGLDRRPVLVHAARARDRARQAAVPQTTTVNRAGLRPHQTQPQIRPPQLSRQAGSTYRVALNHYESQPHKAPPLPDRRPRGLKGPVLGSHGPTERGHHQRCTHPRPPRAQLRGFAKQPPRISRTRWLPSRPSCQRWPAPPRWPRKAGSRRQGRDARRAARAGLS
jgi:hypothetical protein